MITSKFFYRSLLVLNNLIACIFLGLIFMSTFSNSAEAVNPLSERQIFMRIIVYGIVLSAFFSLITFLIGFFSEKEWTSIENIWQKVIYGKS